MATNPSKSGAKAKRVRRTAKKKAPARQAVKPTAKVEAVEAAEAVEAYIPAAAPTTAGGFWTVGTSIRHGDITTFLRQLIMLLEAGTPILKSLRTLSERGEKAAVRQLVADIAQYVEVGNPLWQAFERHPKHFDTVFVNLVKASEASGTLVSVLQRMVDYRERRELLRKRVRGGMLYPVILLFACMAVVMFIARIVVPEFEAMFVKFGEDLPPLTIYFMATAKAIGTYWWVAVVVVAALVLVYKLWYVQNPLRRLTADRIKLKIPVIGSILRKNAIVEFTRTFSLLLKSGLSMMATLELVRNAIHNRAFAETLQGMRDSVERGGGLEQPMRDADDIIPPVVTDMMVTGEESGRLDSIAEQVANTYDEEVNIAIASLGEALQPILTVFIGAIVILLMLAVFLPLISMLDSISGGGAV